MTELDFITRDLTIKDPPDFTVVSTFSGCGGSSTGYVWAGGKVILAVEWDNNAVETYRLNYPDTGIYHGDIAKLSVEEVLERTGLKVGELDIFDGSPPCQGFSTAGKRNFDDDRNQLFREYVRLLRGLKPKVFVMENVSGMVKGKMKLLFVEILTELKQSGYKVSAKLLNAKYLGVPQSRQRLIFIGVRDNLGIEPSHPKPQTRGINVGIALASIREPISNETRPMLDWVREAASYMSGDTYDSKHTYSAFIKASGKSGGYISTHLLSNTRVSCTITKSEIGVSGIIHPNRQRYCTVPELMRIGSYPDSYKFTGNRKQRVERIGNSVPPRMMEYIAEHIKTEILYKIPVS